MKNIFTVIIPAYNAENTISRCLQSVLLQTYLPYEVIVVDDCSCDQTRNAVLLFERDFKFYGINLKYIFLDKNSGPSKARNIGIRNSSGNLIAFLDSDDYWSVGKLNIIRKYMENDVGLIFHQYSERKLEFNSSESGYRVKSISSLRLIIKNLAQTSCVVINRKYLSYFNENMKYCEDYDLWLRISEKAKVIQLIGPPLTFLGRPQLTKGGLSGNRYTMRLGELRVYFNFCKRRWLPRYLFLPFLIILSFFKHCYSFIKFPKRWLGDF